jgi:hypothetical protein
MNRLTVLAVLPAALLVPSTTAAAPLEPLPFERAPALCLSSTGTPGGIALLGPYSRRDSATDLLTLGGDGATRPPLPLRRPLDVRARRRGEEIVVRWRTAGPARRMYFSVLGRWTLRPAGIDFSATRYRSGRGRARFVARLRPDRPRRVRWVAIVAGSYDRARTRTVIVPVR